MDHPLARVDLVDNFVVLLGLIIVFLSLALVRFRFAEVQRQPMSELDAVDRLPHILLGEGSETEQV